jgi:hypothetical protein
MIAGGIRIGVGTFGVTKVIAESDAVLGRLDRLTLKTIL